LAGAYDIRNHILNHFKLATARELKNRSIVPMGEKGKKNDEKKKGGKEGG